ncbi:MAG: hypothetical protein IM638_08760 [Bacteroidetes bacterium]|nr:hypothetical protein [Bacteroidota bacterium]
MFGLVNLFLFIRGIFKSTAAKGADKHHPEFAMSRVLKFQNGMLNLRQVFDSRLENYFYASLPAHVSVHQIHEHISKLISSPPTQPYLRIYYVLPLSESEWLLCCTVRWIDAASSGLGAVVTYPNAGYAELAVRVTADRKQIRINGADYKTNEERGGLQQAAYHVVSGLLGKK